MPDDDRFSPPPARRRKAQPEHALQISCKKFVRDCVNAEHTFLAFDRTAKTSALQHVRESARGVRAGTADTLLLVKGLPPIWVELKAPGNKPSALQLEFAADVERVGCRWYWAASVQQCREVLFAAGVPMRPSAPLVAEHLDGLLAGAAARKAGKAPRSYRPRKPPTTAAGLRFGRIRDGLQVK